MDDRDSYPNITYSWAKDFFQSLGTSFFFGVSLLFANQKLEDLVYLV